MQLIITIVFVVLVFDIIMGVAKHMWKRIKNFNK